MPRTARASVGDYCYHVINCGTGHTEVLHAEGNYQAFETLLKDASQHVPMCLLAYCLMPNHCHLAVWQYQSDALSR